MFLTPNGQIMTVTIAQLETRVKNHVRRTPTELLAELRNIINEAQDEICQRKKYWFLELEATFTITVGAGNWWELVLPTGSPFDSPLQAWEIVTTGGGYQYYKDLDYYTSQQARALYPVPSVLAPRGPIEAFSESDDWTKLIAYPVPIKDTSVFFQYRARSLPDLVADGDNNTLTNEYTGLMEEWSTALCFKFLGEQNRFLLRKETAKQIAIETIDREDVRRRFAAVTTLKQRKGALETATTRVKQTRRFL